MSKKTTRSAKPKSEPLEQQNSTVAALKKVFYIPEQLVNKVETNQRLCLERFYHPGKSRSALFITLDQQNESYIMEILEYAEPRRSWLINSELCSNGRIYISAPIDATLLALHYLRKHCEQRAMSLDSIYDELDVSANRLLTKFVNTDSLKCVADVKMSGDMAFYKYNPERTLAWLALKTLKIVGVLKDKEVHCGHSAQSQNYVRSERSTMENTANEMDFMRMACDIVGRYLDVELYKELVSYLQLPSEIQALVEEKALAQKRKSLQGQTGTISKKIKLSHTDDAASEQVEKNCQMNISVDEANGSITTPNKSMLFKERSLTAKEKALAKSAKGSKSIASFFKVK